MTAPLDSQFQESWHQQHCTNLRHHAVSITLQFHQRSKKLHPHHSALIYALIRAAWGRMQQTKAALPDGVLVQAPEQLRITVEKGERYQFGLTILTDTDRATKTLWTLIEGLKRLGGQAKHQSHSSQTINNEQFGGNFSVVQVTDLVADKPLKSQQPLTAVGQDWMVRQIAKATQLDKLTLRFTTPLRCARSPQSFQKKGHRYLDQYSFDPTVFMRGIFRRLQELGDTLWHESDMLNFCRPPRVDRNQLVWLDVAYGAANRRKTLGGSMGTVSLSRLQPNTAALLAIGQLIHVGENTRFGFGHYHIPELNDDSFLAKRATDLLSLALSGALVDAAADRYEVESGTARHLADQLLAGNYKPKPPFFVNIPKSDGSKRRLAVPQKLDRVLQRAVNDLISPAIDRFLESSSIAYRRGLGRERAARRISKAYREGYRWAVKADFYHFFDTLDHEQLESRLRAYIADDHLVDVLMVWVKNGAPFPEKGLPTGAVISPLLSNLFLDQFDEEISKTKGRLIRYADDFLVLCKSPQQADAIYRQASDLAQQLQLQLNQQKTKLIDMAEAFDFLGFRFERKQQWQPNAQLTTAHIDELGWKPMTAKQKLPAINIKMPNESKFPARSLVSTVIIGPRIRQVDVRDNHVCYAKSDGQWREAGTTDSIEQLVVLGKCDLSARLISVISRRQIQMLITDDIGRPLVRLGENPSATAEVLRQQVQQSQDSVVQQFVAFELLHSKVMNYAALADAYPGRDSKATGAEIRKVALKMCHSQSLAELRGMEGHAAAVWYGRLANRVEGKHRFDRRIAPDAEDPINILLNLGFTQLHRITTALIEVNGLAANIGFLHADRSGHNTLASDFMEPFRFLVDRAVLVASQKITPTDFQATDRGPFPVRIKPKALREFERILFSCFALGVSFEAGQPTISYRMHMARTIRGLKRFLVDRQADFVVPEFADPSGVYNSRDRKQVTGK